MIATRLLLTFGIICISSVICEKKVCEIEDSKCLTETAGLTFVQFITGIPGVEPSDPLHEDLIIGDLPTIKYKLIDSNLSGMKNCKVDLVKISAKDLKYDYHVGCPHLTLVSGYELKGDVGKEFVEGKGTCIIEFYDYNFLFNGEYVSKTGKDGKMHINLKTHTLDIEAKGKVHYDFKNLFNGDKAKSDEFHKSINENWVTMDKTTRQPAMEAFMNKYIDHVNAYLDEVAVQDLFSYP